MNTRQNIFSFERIISFLAGILLTIMVNVLSNWLSDRGGTLLYMGFVLLVIIGAIALAVAARRKRVLVKAVMGNPISIDPETARLGIAKKGLIGFVSLYNPIKDKGFRSLSLEEQKTKLVELRNAAKSLDYQPLNLELSNLEPIIKAITSHQSALQHCWLIATSGENGSSAFVPVLERYLREKKGISQEKCTFHYGENYEIYSDRTNETEVVEKTRILVDKIFKEACDEYHLEDSEIVGDITGGFRSMPLGMTLACLDETRDIEFVGTQYKETSPAGELHPMIFHFETRIIEE